MTSFLYLTLGFVKQIWWKQHRRITYGSGFFMFASLSLGIFSSIMENTYPLPRKGNEGHAQRRFVVTHRLPSRACCFGPHFVTPVRDRPIGRHTPPEDSFQAASH